jgi:outer membrane protein assembly factor BamB
LDRRSAAGLALLSALAACETPPAIAIDAGVPDAPLLPCNAPTIAPDGGELPPPDPTARGERAWTYQDPLLAFLQSQPAVAPDGTILVSASIRLFALSPTDGSVRWVAKSSEAEPFVPVPVVDGAGRVAMTSGQVALYLFAPDGSLVFRAQLGEPAANGGPVSAPVLTADGFAFAAGGGVFWLDPCGQVLATYTHDALLLGDLAAGADGTIYAGEPAGGAVVAIGPDGKKRWRTAIGAAPGDLAIAGDGAVVATTGAGGDVAILDGATGAIRKQMHLDARTGGPIVLGDGTVVVAATAQGNPTVGRLHALGADLSPRWSMDLPGQVTLLPVATTGGIIVGASDGTTARLVDVDAQSGAIRFATPCDACTFVGTPAAIGDDGNAYADALRSIVALRTPGVLDPASPWPRARGADNRNAARMR